MFALRSASRRLARPALRLCPTPMARPFALAAPRTRAAELSTSGASETDNDNVSGLDSAALEQLSPDARAALARAGITALFPIQAATLPYTAAGRDVVGRAFTGTGKVSHEFSM